MQGCGKAQVIHRDRLETGFGCCGGQGVEIQAGQREELAGTVFGDPAFHRRESALAGLAGKVELSAAPGSGHDIPAIGGRFGLVDQDHAGGTLPGGFLILVGPATVIGHGIAVEEAGLRVGITGVVDQHDHRLACNIEAFIVVPVIFGGHDAIAHKDKIAVLDLNLVGGQLGPVDDVFAHAQAQRLAIMGDVKTGRFRIERDLQQRYRLEIASVESRFQTDAGHLVGNPLACGDSAFGCRRAARESIVGQGRNAPAQIGFLDRRCGRRRGVSACRRGLCGLCHRRVGCGVIGVLSGRTRREHEASQGRTESKMFHSLPHIPANLALGMAAKLWHILHSCKIDTRSRLT